MTSLFQLALCYAAEQHAGQFRKGLGTPYFAHPLQVAGLVLEFGGTEQAAMAAVLHDVLEDCGGMPRYEEITTQFGPAVAKLVLECSEDLTLPKVAWRARKEATLAKIPRLTEAAQLIVACDKLHNLRSLIVELRALKLTRDDRSLEIFWGRFRGGQAGTIWYYQEIVNALSQSRIPASLVGEMQARSHEFQDVAAGRS